MKKHNRVNY